MQHLESEVEQAWDADAELSAARQELVALKQKIRAREDVILQRVKQRMGLPEHFTDFEWLLEERRAGIC